MAQSSEIALVLARRRQLVLESSQLRRQADADLARLAETLTWVERGYSVLQSVRSYWPLLVGAAGFLVARKKGGWVRSLGRLFSMWRVARRLVRLWQGLKA